MRVLIEYRFTPQIHNAALAGMAIAVAAPSHAAPAIVGLSVDGTFAPVQIPRRTPAAHGVPLPTLAHLAGFSFEPEESSYLVRGTIPDQPDAQQQTLAEAEAHPDVVGVFSDPEIVPFAAYCGAAAVGNAADVASKLGVPALAAAGLDGRRVDLAIVDTGINLARLKSLGRTARVSSRLSWTPAGVPTKPGKHAVDHGTMCAFDATIAAPGARLLDVAVLLSNGVTFAGLLSDAVAAYGHLLTMVRARKRPRALVVSNSWGLFNPANDFPVGSPGNYSDNPNHPFNIVVSSLEAAGADILFAAGNCGRDCPDGRCNFASAPVCGANSHPRVLSIGGVDTKQRRVGYSSQGPGRLAPQKPDVMAYTHFTGSGVFAPDPDSGTSAACPVAAGVIAAVRSRHSPVALTPADLRNLVTKTAIDLGGTGWDPDFGWGLLQPADLVAAIA
jgi:subtilisin family serine protease